VSVYPGSLLLGGTITDSGTLVHADFPRLVIQAAFGSAPDDDPPTWTTIHDTDTATGYVRSLRYRRGRSNQLARFDTGTAELLLRNDDRAWDPQNTASPFYPYVRPMLAFQAYAVWLGVTYPLTKQFANGFPRRRIGPIYAEAQIGLSDAMKRFAKKRIPPAQATVTTALAGSNNDLVYTAKTPGADGNNISVVYFQTHFRPLRHQTVVVTVNDKQVRVDFIDDGSVESADVLSAVQAEPNASLLVSVAHAPGNDGTGTIFPMAETHLAGGDTLPFPQEAGGARIGRVLDLAGWPTGQRELSPGVDLHSPLAFPTQETGKLLSHIQDVAAVQAENGFVFIDGRGYWMFIDRRDKIVSPRNQPAAVFSDQPAGGEYPYTDATPVYDDDLIINDVVNKGIGVPQAAFDADSDLEFGTGSQSFDSTLALDGDVAAAAQMITVEFAQPMQRIAQITVMPATDPAAWTATLGLEIGDRVTVKEHPPGGGAPNSSDYVIQGLAWEFPPGPLAAAKAVYDLWPADPIHDWFALDDPVRGLLDTTNRIGR
jgi:hypothetical protein